MSQIVHSDSVLRVDPGKPPDYDADNPLLRLLNLVEQSRPVAERECYEPMSLQHLFPIRWLELYGPAPPDADQLDPAQQDSKTDFQKQNVRNFHLGDTRAVRGWAVTANWRGPFLRLSYRGGPGSTLCQAVGQLGDAIGCVVTVQGAGPVTLQVPYDDDSDFYVVELWGHSGDGLRDQLGSRARQALDSRLLQPRTDLLTGGADDFHRDKLTGQDLRSILPQHAMHPILPLYADIRWTQNPDGSGKSDPPIRLGFEMRVRGREAFLGVGTSPNPHGGVGFLEYRNLFSNYGQYAGSAELGRALEPWNLDAFGRKGHASGDSEPFLAVDYLDLHVLEPACSIGLHRHRDNQEAFMMLDGEGIMVIGDWAESGTRTRSFEVRHLTTGHLALLKGGNLHALANPTNRQASLFMFGGYD